MPFYEYECANCKFYIEEMQKITDTPLTKCPSCGQEALKKLVSAPIFRLKGAGWYETDFKGDKEDKRNLAASEAEESPKAEAASESPKAEAPKAEASKPETVTTKSPSKVAAASKSASGSSGSSPSKASAGKRTSTGRPAKPVTKVAASKSRPAPAVRSKTKPAAKAAARKKARR